jgi:hypothetical protein
VLPRPLRPDVKKKTAHASEQDRPDVAGKREAWFDDQPELDPARLIFIDETWASTNMARRRGRSPSSHGAKHPRAYRVRETSRPKYPVRQRQWSMVLI